MFWALIGSGPPPWPWWVVLLASVHLLLLIGIVSYVCGLLAAITIRHDQVREEYEELLAERQQHKDAEIERLRARVAELEAERQAPPPGP